MHAPDPEGNLRIEAQALFSQPSRGGFLPVRVTVSNKTKNAGTVKLHCVSSASGYRAAESQVESDFSIKGEAEKTISQDILVPLFNAGSRNTSESIRVQMSGSFGEAQGSLNVDGIDGKPAVLLSEPLYTKNASALDSQAATKVTGSGSRYGHFSFAAKFDPRQLPEDWRAYSGYDAIAMTDSDWSAVTPGARNAIMQWNRLGGRLVIYVDGAADLKSLGIKTDPSGGRSMGQVTTLPLPAAMTLAPVETVDFFYGVKPRELPKPFHQSINEDYSSSSVWPLQSLFGEKSFHYAVFVIVLIVFAILVGPVNLFVFAKSGRRHRLFITTPLIALGASAVLMMLIFFEDGFGGRGMRLVLMEVRPDNGENSAYINQEQISRTGVLLGSSFEMKGQAMITPVRMDPSNWSRYTNDSGVGSRFEIQAVDGNLKVQGDWFQSRSEQGQALEAVMPTRGRIEARSESGAPVLLSTFDFPIRTLWYTDPSGAIWKAENITAGKAFTCSQGDASERNLELKRMSESLRRKADGLFDRKGSFVAVTDEAPAIETFSHIAWKQTHTVITGPIAAP
ncbi:MAG: hypothetical protein JWO82_464 [Akkermansiaceae bacterium]|nr:hypothetical protein [Akkermansiaceae bacterium]